MAYLGFVKTEGREPRKLSAWLTERLVTELSKDPHYMTFEYLGTDRTGDVFRINYDSSISSSIRTSKQILGEA